MAKALAPAVLAGEIDHVAPAPGQRYLRPIESLRIRECGARCEPTQVGLRRAGKFEPALIQCLPLKAECERAGKALLDTEWALLWNDWDERSRAAGQHNAR